MRAFRTAIEAEIVRKRRRMESRINGMSRTRTGRELPKPRGVPRRTLAFAAVLVCALLTVGAGAYITAAPGDYQPIRVDGDFSDWSTYPDRGGWREVVTQVRHYYLFAVPTQGRTDANRMDAFRMWIDTDNDARTGLLVDGIGADLRLVLQFWRGEVKDASLCVWQGEVAWGYTEFAGCTGIPAASSAGRVEFALMTWLLGDSPSWVSETLPVLGARTTLRHGGSVQPEESHGSLIWRDYVQADGTTGEWSWLKEIGLAETYTSNGTGTGRLQILNVTARVSLWNTSLVLNLRAGPLPIPFRFSAPPTGEPARTPGEETPGGSKRIIPDRRDRLTMYTATENATLRLWQGRVMDVSSPNGSAYAAGRMDALEFQITRSWIGVGFTLEPSDDLEDAPAVNELQDSFFAPTHLPAAPEPPRPNDILGNLRYWFRNTAHATETACTGTNDKNALTTQGAGAMQTITLTTGQNACWYADATTGTTIPAGDWETLLDVNTTGDNGGAGNAIGAVVYKSTAGTCGGATASWCPKLSYWNGGGSWTTAYELPSAGAPIENVRVLWDPLLTYKHWVVVNAGATITVYYCSDFVLLAPVCSSLGTATTEAVGTAPERHWDAAMEQSSGDGLLVYDNPANSGNTLCYRTFTTTLSSETCVDHSWVNTTTPAFEYIQLQSNPGVNNLALLAADTTNNDAILWMWSGTAWLPGDDERAATLTYTLTKSYPGVIVTEDSANEFTAFAGDGADNTNVCEWTSAAGWEYDNGGTVTCGAFDPNPSANNDVRTMSTGYAYDIGANKALTGQNDDTNDVDMWAWLGAAGAGGTVGTLQEPSSTDCSAVCRDYDFAFDPALDDVGTYGDGLVVLWDDVDNRCEYRAWDDTTDGWSGTGIFQACTVGGAGLVNWFTAIQSPYTTDTYNAMILRSNDNNDVYAHWWDGDFDTAASGINHIFGETQLSADTTDQAYPYFDFAWGQRPVEYDVRIEVWNLNTDTVASTVGSCLNVITRGNDVQCLISGVSAQVISGTQVVRVYIAHSSAAGSVLIDYDDADSTGDSRLTVPIPEAVLITALIVLPLLLVAAWVRRRGRGVVPK